MSQSDDTHSEPTFRDAMRVAIAERWEQVWAATPVAIEGSDPEGVHDVRVASRRLRAAMDVAADAFPQEWYPPLHKLAKKITKELGAVRDRDVLIEAFERDRAEAPPEEWPGIDLVIARIEAERSEARSEMEQFLRGLEATGAVQETRRRFSDAEKKKVKSADPKESGQ